MNEYDESKIIDSPYADESDIDDGPLDESPRPPRRLWRCWWFGCLPAYFMYESAGDNIPCRRCGAWDVSYSDLVGDTRHNRLKEWLLSRLRAPVRLLGDEDESEIPF